MRLFDKLLSGPIGKDAKDEMSKAIVVVCDDVARDVDGKLDQSFNCSDFPSSRPPWDRFFIEWSMRGMDSRFAQEFQQWGWYCVGSTTESKRDGLNRTLGYLKMDDRRIQGLGVFSDVVFATPFACMEGAVKTVPFYCLWCFDPLGNLAKLLAYTLPPHEDLTNFASLYSLTPLMALMFANCSNVKLEDVTEDVAPPPKIRRRLKLPEVKRYTLNIAGHASRPSRDSNQGPQGAMPFHLCRGHFATYSVDKPLFGNPKLVGRYWHPPHMKGKKENGEVVKDYAIADGISLDFMHGRLDAMGDLQGNTY